MGRRASFGFFLGGSFVLLALACTNTNYPATDPPGLYKGGSYGSTATGGSTLDGGDAPIDVVVPVDTKTDTVVPTDGRPPPPVDGADSTPSAPCSGCVVLDPDHAANAFSLALDATSVYWTSGWTSGATPTAMSGVGLVASVPRAGGTETLLATALTGPMMVKVANTWIAFTELGASSGAGNAYVGGPIAFQDVGTALTSPFGVALDSVNGYWLASTGSGVVVQAAPLTTCSTPPCSMTLGTGMGGFLPQGMTVSTTTSTLYFAAYLSGGGGGIFSMPTTGGTPTQIAIGDSKSHPVDIALDEAQANLYWTDIGDGAVYSMPAAGGTVATVASGLMTPARIAVDATNVYYSDTAGMALYEAPLAGGAPKTLVPSSDALAIVGVAADDVDTNVYFSSQSMILSHPK